MRRSYQRVLYSKVKYIAASWNNNIIYTGAGSYYEIVTLGGTTNWHLLGVSGSWRLSDGTFVSDPVNLAAVRIGYIFKRNSATPSGTNHGLVQTTRKMYLPCNHVYDIYLKDGGNINYGGDFYTQQNTGQNAGGADSFLFLEKTILSLVPSYDIDPPFKTENVGPLVSVPVLPKPLKSYIVFPAPA